MTKYDYDNNGIARVFDDGKWYLINRAEERVSEGYTYKKNVERATTWQSWEPRKTSCARTEASY